MEKLVEASLNNLKQIYRKEKEKYILNDGFKMSSLYFLTIDESAGDSLVTIPANSTVNAQMSTDNSGAIDIRHLSSVATSDQYLVSIQESGRKRDFMNQPIHAKCLFGKSGRFLELPFPIFLGQSHALFFSFTDLSGFTNYIRPAFAGARYHFAQAFDKLHEQYPDAKKASPYFYTTNSPVSLSGSGSATAYITFLGIADFVIHNPLVYSTGAFKVKIYDALNSRSMTSGYIHSDNFGNAEYNKVFAGTVIQRSTTLRFDFVDLSTSTNNIYFSFSGINYWWD
jgi:hypothetical protein